MKTFKKFSQDLQERCGHGGFSSGHLGAGRFGGRFGRRRFGWGWNPYWDANQIFYQGISTDDNDPDEVNEAEGGTAPTMVSIGKLLKKYKYDKTGKSIDRSVKSGNEIGSSTRYEQNEADYPEQNHVVTVTHDLRWTHHHPKTKEKTFGSGVDALKTHLSSVHKVEESEGAPTNSAGSGNIAGIGVASATGQKNFAEPGVDPIFQRIRKQVQVVGPPVVADPRIFRDKIFGHGVQGPMKEELTNNGTSEGKYRNCWRADLL